MPMLEQRNFRHLSHRAIIPLVPVPLEQRPAVLAAHSVNFLQLRSNNETTLPAETEDRPDLNNVQGDVIYVFPKVRS